MSAPNSLPVAYTPASQPALSQGSARYLQQQLSAIASSITMLNLLTPQPATEAPKVLLDGMIRLSRSPWRPVSGATTDAWVYYDLPTTSWLLLHAN